VSPEERAKKVAEAIANIGNPEYRKTMREPLPQKLSEYEAEELHRRAQAQRFK
jgi:hypothetical protein